MKLTGDSGTWRLGHRPALDGLRAIAVLMVVVTHFTPPNPLPGMMGVTVFFTLSGFLITSLLLEERQRTGRISWLGFYRRRALRLLPALVVMVTAVCLLTWAGLHTKAQPAMVASIAGYVSNWYFAATAANGATDWGALGHTWSLAIEEQFYLFWPIVVLLALRWGRRGVLTTATVGAAASLGWWAFTGRSSLYTDVSAYGLLVGCALAAWMHQRPARGAPRWVPAIALIPLTVFAGLDADRLAHVAVPLLTAVAIFAAVQVDVGWLAWSPLQWAGRRSYGLYLWHAPVAYVLLPAAGRWPLIAAATVGILTSFALTALSWRFVEQPFLRLKDRSARSGVGPDGSVLGQGQAGAKPALVQRAIHRV